MLKKTKRVVIFTTISLTAIILIIFGLMIFGPQSLYTLNYTDELLTQLNPEELNKKVSEFRIIYILLSFSVLILSSILSIFLSKSISLPIIRLVRTVQMLLKGENLDYKYFKTNKEEADEFAEAFASMNSELKEALSEATRQKNEIETILLHMNDGVISFNIQGEITHINKAAKEALDLNEKHKFSDFASKTNLNFTMEKIIFLEDIAAQRKYINLGDKFYDIFFAPLKNKEGFAEGIVVVMQDITQHVNLDEMRRRFVADVSHELKTPITSIIGYSEILMDTKKPPEAEMEAKFKKRIMSEAERMNELVSDLLTLSKYDSERAEKKKQEIDIVELVKDRTDSMKNEAEEKNIELTCTVTSEIPKMYADKLGIDRVITNIISNAIKYTEEGSIKVFLGYVANNIYIKVIDTGIGIEEKNLGRIFDRFYRVDDSRVRKNKKGGSGLGLSIVKKIVDQNNGLIEVKSKLGEGTEVVIRFPKIKENTKDDVRDISKD